MMMMMMMMCVKWVRVGQRRAEKDRPARKKLYVLFKLMQLVRSAEDIEWHVRFGVKDAIKYGKD